MILGKHRYNYEKEQQKLVRRILKIHFICSQFTRITTIEQRRQYKTEFDNDYAEYMRLHADTERVSKRFAYLEESLRNQVHNDQRYKVIKNFYAHICINASSSNFETLTIYRKFNGKF